MESDIKAAYRAVRDHEPRPKIIFIRSARAFLSSRNKLTGCRSIAHETSTINGNYEKDPEGYHVTLNYKNEDHIARNTHVTLHAYVDDDKNLNFRKASGTGEKPDSTPRTRNGRRKNMKPCWPDHGL